MLPESTGFCCGCRTNNRAGSGAGGGPDAPALLQLLLDGATLIAILVHGLTHALGREVGDPAPREVDDGGLRNQRHRSHLRSE